MQKQNIRIWVDLTKFNESIHREKHDLPSVDQTLGRLAGAKVFTKLVANSGFWQVPLSPSSETYHVHHAIPEVLLSKATLWDHVST